VLRVILDVDPGIDDALAILFAAGLRSLNLEAVTVVSGNVHVEKGCLNALRMLEVAGVGSVPVARGAERPLVREHIDAEEIHGRDGLGDSGLPPPRLKPSPEYAPDLMVKKIHEAGRDSITIIATAPLTNIALALKGDTSIAGRVGRIIVMGGLYGLTKYGRGNITPMAEYNIYEDPEAAGIVFNSGAPITAIGLDVTMKPSAALTPDHIRILSEAGSEVADVAVKITRRMMERWGVVYLHDPIAVAMALDKKLFKVERHRVKIDTEEGPRRGRTVLTDEGSLIDICVDIDGSRFLDLFLKTLTST